MSTADELLGLPPQPDLLPPDARRFFSSPHRLSAKPGSYWPTVRRWVCTSLGLHVTVLENGFHRLESDRPIQSNGRQVVHGDFQGNLAAAHRLKAL